MHTEDDKYTKYKSKINYSKSNRIVKGSNSSNIDAQDYYEDYYKDYYDDYKSNNSYNVSDVNKNEINYVYENNSLFKKKYAVIIIILFIFLSALIVVLMQTINVKTVPIGSNNYIRLFYDELNLKVGQTKKLEVSLSETNKKYKIVWFSNNNNVVTVDRNGNIKAINEGEAIILVAYYVDDKIYDDECRIYVSK